MKTIDIYENMSKIPYGRNLFTSFLCLKAPYFSTISPTIHDLKKGYARASIKKRRKIENHIGTVHAIAMCNLAELVGGLMTEVSIPSHIRWIPSGMNVEYLAKATTNLTAIADGTNINWDQIGDVVVPVEVKDSKDQTVFKANITMFLSQKKPRN